MLKRITAQNFMLFDNLDIDNLDQHQLVLISGNNGCGKSALLEIMYFVLYGGCRAGLSLSDLITLGCTEPMKCSAEFVDIPAQGDVLQIERQVRRSSASSKCKVILNNEIVASSASQAKEYIPDLLGETDTEFLLTTFFGLGNNDSLVETTPSKKLETLQKLADTGECKRWNAELATTLSAVKSEIAVRSELLTTLWEELNNIDTTTSIESEFATVSGRLKAARTSFSALNHKLTSLVVTKQKAASLQSGANKLSTDIQELQEDSESIKDRWTRNLKALNCKKEALKSTLANYNALDSSVIDSIDSLKSEISKITVRIDLYNIALKSSEASRCPLCDSPLSDDILSQWTSKLEDYSAELLSKQQDLIAAQKVASSIRSYQEAIASTKKDLAVISSDIGHDVESMRNLAEKKRLKSSELKTVQAELTALESKLDQYNSLSADVQLASTAVQELEVQSGILEARMREAKSQKVLSSLKAKISSTEKLLKKLHLNSRALELAIMSTGRYGAPLVATKSLRQYLSTEATLLYNSFQEGIVSIPDIVDKGRPGIDYVVSTTEGEKRFAHLSVGQKAMLLISIRFALAMRIKSKNQSSYDFTVLDEVMENLSASNRDELLTIIKSKLFNHVRQVFVVSHAEVTPLFDAEIRVALRKNSKGKTVSRVKLVSL